MYNYERFDVPNCLIESWFLSHGVASVVVVDVVKLCSCQLVRSYPLYCFSYVFIFYNILFNHRFLGHLDTQGVVAISRSSDLICFLEGRISL